MHDARKQEKRRNLLKAALSVLLYLGVLNASMLSAWAGEVDNYYAWGHDIKDSRAAFNNFFNIQIKTILATINRKGGFNSEHCEGVALEIMKKLGATRYPFTYRGALNTEMEYWAQESPALDHLPKLGESLAEYARKSIYAPEMTTFGVSTDLDVIVNVGGVYFGTDKISHFLGSGFEYYRKYLKYRKNNTETMAKALAIKWGVGMENGIIGTKAVGIFAYADLEANFQGMEMAIDFCSQPTPYLKYQENKWELVRAAQLQNYVNPNWDESYNVSAYTRKRLSKVRVNIQELGLCNKLQSTWVENLRQSYNARNTINQSSSGFLDTGLSSKLLHISQKFQQEPFDEKVYEQLTETYQINLSFQDFLEFNKGLTLRDQNYFTLHYLCSHAEAGPIQ